MRGFFLLCVVALTAGQAAGAQTPQRDSASIADSAARADSIALVRELESQQQSADTAGGDKPTGAQGASNPRLLPDISVVGDLIARPFAERQHAGGSAAFWRSRS